MAHLCEMNQIGHVASVKGVGKNLIVRIASNANYKNGEGAWVERTHWNEHTIFERQGGLLKWASESLKPGDLVLVGSAVLEVLLPADDLLVSAGVGVRRRRLAATNGLGELSVAVRVLQLGELITQGGVHPVELLLPVGHSLGADAPLLGRILPGDLLPDILATHGLLNYRE